MMDIGRFFSRELRAFFKRSTLEDSGFSLHTSEGLEVEYLALVESELYRKRIDMDCVDVSVRKIGTGPGGFDVFVGMIRLERWDKPTVVQLLLGLPLLEAKVRRSVRETWLADYSHFGGLWVHASEQLHTRGDLADLKPMMQRLSGSIERGAHDGAQGECENQRAHAIKEAH